MGTNDQFPWELLKADCLRLVCAQLVEASSEGQKSYKPARKEDMVTFLRDVHQRGGNASNPNDSLTYLLLADVCFCCYWYSHQSFGRCRTT